MSTVLNNMIEAKVEGQEIKEVKIFNQKAEMNVDGSEEKKEIIKNNVYECNTDWIVASGQMQFLLDVEGVEIGKDELKKNIDEMVKKAWELGSEIFSITDAIEWGKDFKFPFDVGKKDGDDLNK